MSTLSTSATATPANAVDSCKATESLRDISSGKNNQDSEKIKSNNLQRETSAVTTTGKRKIDGKQHGEPQRVTRRRNAIDSRSIWMF
ncbi:MAG: hypothetical protein MHMPM18_004072 [Marteilia pararefringens]